MCLCNTPRGYFHSFFFNVDHIQSGINSPITQDNTDVFKLFLCTMCSLPQSLTAQVFVLWMLSSLSWKTGMESRVEPHDVGEIVSVLLNQLDTHTSLWEQVSSVQEYQAGGSAH